MAGTGMNKFESKLPTLSPITRQEKICLWLCADAKIARCFGVGKGQPMSSGCGMPLTRLKGFQRIEIAEDWELALSVFDPISRRFWLPEQPRVYPEQCGACPERSWSDSGAYTDRSGCTLTTEPDKTCKAKPAT